jgi:hypothetical protein
MHLFGVQTTVAGTTDATTIQIIHGRDVNGQLGLYGLVSLQRKDHNQKKLTKEKETLFLVITVT